MNKLLKNSIWILIAVLGASAVGGIALNRGENINALWFITAALCVYAIAYRFYAAWIAATVFLWFPSSSLGTLTGSSSFLTLYRISNA